MTTKQIEFWEGDFGKEYTDRNTFNHEKWNQLYIDYFGIMKMEMDNKFIGNLPRDIRILEVGCNSGQQLEGLQKEGFTNLYGIDLQWYAVHKAHQLLEKINVIQGSGFELPFRDNFFDLVCTNGVLIHIAPEDLNKIMDEMYRCSNRYIWGFENFAEELTALNYRGNLGYLWKTDFCQLFLNRFPDLKVVRKEIIPYTIAKEVGNNDCMYLLEKR